MMIAAVDKRHASIDGRKSCGCFKAAEPAADDHNGFLHPDVPIMPDKAGSLIALAIPPSRGRQFRRFARTRVTSGCGNFFVPGGLGAESPHAEPVMPISNLFSSYFQGGFECSTHRRADGRRLDLCEATHHARLVAADYATLGRHAIRTVRDGLRWHLIERSPGRYDWSSFVPMLRAARDHGMQVIWDLCHYGWPDDLDIWTPAFVDRFAAFAAAAARVVADETNEVPVYCPINEISYFAWAGGEAERFHPLARGRGNELKRQLVRAAIAAIHSVRDINPRTRIMHSDPIINVVADAWRPQDRAAAQNYHQGQFEAWDMLSGRLAPELGGSPDNLDIMGANFYWDNQWILNGPTLGFGHPFYRPLSELLAELHDRYRRPILIAETGAEARNGPAWLRYVAGETRTALKAGVPMEGICLYPILHYPGWDDERHCECGLLSRAGPDDRRKVDALLAAELRIQQAAFADLRHVGVPAALEEA